MPKKAVLVLGLRWWILHSDGASTKAWRKSSACANEGYKETSK